MEKKLSFNENADNYDRLRPRYCQELFADIAAYAGLQEGAAALEVGAGTGQATGPFLERGCQVTAIEPGAQLAGILNQKHRESAKLSVKNCLFEDFSAPSGSFDLIYAGTAFHWVPEEAGYPKAKKLLRGSATEPGSEQRRCFVSAMRETLAVANAEGIELTEADLTQMVHLIEGLDPAGMPSMAQDRVARRKTEVDEFAGTICRLAAKHGIQVPQNEWLYSRIREIEASW